jgi:hypothetical protein
VLGRDSTKLCAREGKPGAHREGHETTAPTHQRPSVKHDQPLRGRFFQASEWQDSKDRAGPGERDRRIRWIARIARMRTVHDETEAVYG